MYRGVPIVFVFLEKYNENGECVHSVKLIPVRSFVSGVNVWYGAVVYTLMFDRTSIFSIIERLSNKYGII